MSIIFYLSLASSLQRINGLAKKSGFVAIFFGHS